MRIFLFILCALSQAVSDAATYFVSTGGNNLNDGLSLSQSFATLQFAADVVMAGDSVLIADGTYSGFDLRTTGTVSQPIVFLALGHSCLINTPGATNDGINVEDADYIEINGFIVNDQPRNGIRLVNADFCIVRNNVCDNNFERGIFTGFTDSILIENNVCTGSQDEHGIYVSNSSDWAIIRNNVCHGNNGSGIQINADASLGGDGISSYCEIYGNMLYNNGNGGGAAINLDGNDQALVYNNLIYDTHATGIALFQIDGATGSTNARIYHNTIVIANDGRWCLTVVNGSTGATVRNNIFLSKHSFRGSIDIDPSSQNGFTSDHNLVLDRFTLDGGNSILTLSDWQNLGYGSNSVLYDDMHPLFEDEASGNFQLTMGAQGIDLGQSNLMPSIDEDIEGNSRLMTTPDMGAYEFEGATLAIDEPRDTLKQDTLGQSDASLQILTQEATIDFSNVPFNSHFHLFDLSGRLLVAHLNYKHSSLSIPRSLLPSGVYVYHFLKSGVVQQGVIFL